MSGPNYALAHIFAQLSDLAYLKFETNKQLLLEPLEKMGFLLVDTFVDIESDTQAYLVSNNQYGVLVFRGTDNLLDWFTNVKFKADDTYILGMHRGFSFSLKAVENGILESLKKLGNLPLYSTGHSLGGALAKACILRIQANWISSYTFGSPAICTSILSANNKIPVHRFIYAGDIVPRCMEIGMKYSFIAIWLLQFVVWVLSILPKRFINWLNLHIDLLKAILPDLGKYSHFGSPYYYEEGGMLITEIEGSNLFRQVITKNIKTIVDHHSIKRYVSIMDSASVIYKQETTGH